MDKQAFKVIHGAFAAANANTDTKNLRGMAMAIDSLLKFAKYQRMSGSQAGLMVSDVLKEFGISIPESFINPANLQLDGYSLKDLRNVELEQFDKLITTQCEISPEGKTFGPTLYTAYLAFCELNKAMAASKKKFHSLMVEKGIASTKTRQRQIMWLGLSLK